MHKQRRDVLRQIGFFAAAVSAATLLPLSRAEAQGSGNYTRGRTSPLPKIVKTPAELTSAKLVLPYSKSAAMMKGGGALPSYKYTPGAYESVGLQKYMGSTGERQEIGLVTEAQATWMAGGSPSNMLAQAEAHGSVPAHALIDGRMIDVLKYPMATYDARAPSRGWKPYFDISGAVVTPDGAHYPALCYVAYLATGDQYYLEELQFAATFHVCGGPPDYAQGKGIIFPWQQRQVAWGLRDLFAAYIATPDGDVPAPLLPKSYWKKIIDNNIAFYMDRYVNKGGPLIQEMGFLAIDDLPSLAPWQQDYLSMVLGWAVWTGHIPQLRPLYDFQIRQAVKRATGPLRSQAVQYNFPSGAADNWAAMLAKNGRKPTPDGHFDSAIVNPVPDYPGFLRGALKVAVMNGVKGAEEAFAFADAEARRRNYIPMRWAV